MIPKEEKQTVKWFLLISYIILIGYDYFFYYLAPANIVESERGLPSSFGG
jgi:hypothetical protein